MTQDDTVPQTRLKQFADDELLPIHYLNDLLFCQRRAALHVNEQVWAHNRYTVEGLHAHQRVDRAAKSTRAGITTACSVWLVSRRLGLVGLADVVEFHAADDSTSPETQPPHGPSNPLDSAHSPAAVTSHASESVQGRVPYPIDYKRGRRRRWDNDDVQLCAQALCLEEMLGVAVPRGAIFHVKSRKRRELVFDDPLREKTVNAAWQLRQLVANGTTPPPAYSKKCDGCSLKEICLPKAIRPRATASRYLARVIEGQFESMEDTAPP